MRIQFLCRICCCIIFLIPFTTNATIVTLASTLTPEAEIPSATAPGAVGSAAMILDTNTSQFSWVIEFSGLTGPATAAHFHEGAADQTGPVVLDLDTDPGVTFSGVGQSSGMFSGGKILSSTDIDNILAGLWYINIHTVANGPGELRGQVLGGTFSPVPLPGAIWMFLPAIGLLSISARRRQT